MLHVHGTACPWHVGLAKVVRHSRGSLARDRLDLADQVRNPEPRKNPMMVTRGQVGPRTPDPSYSPA